MLASLAFSIPKYKLGIFQKRNAGKKDSVYILYDQKNIELVKRRAAKALKI